MRCLTGPSVCSKHHTLKIFHRYQLFFYDRGTTPSPKAAPLVFIIGLFFSPGCLGGTWKRINLYSSLQSKGSFEETGGKRLSIRTKVERGEKKVSQFIQCSHQDAGQLKRQVSHLPYTTYTLSMLIGRNIKSHIGVHGKQLSSTCAFHWCSMKVAVVRRTVTFWPIMASHRCKSQPFGVCYYYFLIM